MSCLTLFRQPAPWAFSLALAKAGRSRPARIAMMAMTTSSSINVKAVERQLLLMVVTPTGADKLGDAMHFFLGAASGIVVAADEFAEAGDALAVIGFPFLAPLFTSRLEFIKVEVHQR